MLTNLLIAQYEQWKQTARPSDKRFEKRLACMRRARLLVCIGWNRWGSDPFGQLLWRNEWDLYTCLAGAYPETAKLKRKGTFDALAALRWYATQFGRKELRGEPACRDLLKQQEDGRDQDWSAKASLFELLLTEYEAIATWEARSTRKKKG